MKLKELHIENFRSFENEIIYFDDCTCFVGANGSGKSTVLMALNIFFRNNASTSTDVIKLSEEDFHNKIKSKPILIKLVFEDLSKEAKQEFKHYYRQGKLIVIAKAEWDEEKGNAGVKQYGQRLVMKEFAEYFEAVENKARVDELKLIYKRIRENIQELPDVKTGTAMQQALREYEENHEELCALLDDTSQFYGWSKGTNKMEKYIQWIYVPAVKDASTEQEESNKTALGYLLERTIRTKIDFSESISNLKIDLENRYREIIDKEKGILLDIQDSLVSRLRSWSYPGANLDLSWHCDNEKSIVINEPAARVAIGEGDFLGEIARLGHGMQRAFLLSILQELGESDQENRPTLLLSIEEPELYQHPPQAQHMSNLLNSIAKDAKSNSQIVITTHSPYFVSCDKFESVRMVRKELRKNITKIKGTNYGNIENSLSKALDEEPGSPTSLMAVVSQIMYPSQKELFFTPHAIFVEGIEDVAFISTQLELNGQMVEFKRLGCHFVISGGKTNLSRLIAISNELEIPYYVIFDADSNKDKKEEREKNKKDNTCILRLCKAQNIEPFPGEAHWDKNLVLWTENIAKTVKDDVGVGEWEKAHLAIIKKYNYTQLKQKNAILITAILEELFSNNIQSKHLIKLCGEILRCANIVSIK